MAAGRQTIQRLRHCGSFSISIISAFLAPIAAEILLRRGSAQKIEAYSGKSSQKINVDIKLRLK